MKRDILIGIVGGSILLIGLWLFWFKTEKEIIYVNCDSFETQEEAQEYFLKNKATHLDRDKDGVACEELAL